MSSPVVIGRNVLKKNSMRFAAALIAVLISFVVGPNAVRAAAPQHHDQVPGFYRLKVGDLEVTALFDGFGVFELATQGPKTPFTYSPMPREAPLTSADLL